MQKAQSHESAELTRHASADRRAKGCLPWVKSRSLHPGLRDPHCQLKVQAHSNPSLETFMKSSCRPKRFFTWVSFQPSRAPVALCLLSCCWSKAYGLKNEWGANQGKRRRVRDTPSHKRLRPPCQFLKHGFG